MKQVLILFLILSSCIGSPPDESGTLNLETIWKLKTENIDAPNVQPLVIDDAKVIISGQKELVAVDVDTGDEIWRGSIDDQRALISSVILYDEKHQRIFSNHREDLKVWNAETGKLLFNLTKDTGVQAFTLGKHVVLEDGYGVVGDTLDAYILKLDGSVRFTIQISFASAGLSYSENTIYMTLGKTINGGLTRGKIVAFNALSGDSLWFYNTDNGGFINTAPFIENGVLYAGAIGNSPVNEVVALHAETGELIWRQTDYVWTQTMSMSDKYLYINTGVSLAALNKIDGSIAWRYEWTSFSGAEPVYLEGYVYHTDHNQLFVIDDSNGKLVHSEPVPQGGFYFWHVAASSDKIFAQTSRQLIAYQPWHLRGQ